jgi:hypothetical protein
MVLLKRMSKDSSKNNFDVKKSLPREESGEEKDCEGREKRESEGIVKDLEAEAVGVTELRRKKGKEVGAVMETLPARNLNGFKEPFNITN